MTNFIRCLFIVGIIGAFTLFCYIGERYVDKDFTDNIIKQVTTW